MEQKEKLEIIKLDMEKQERQQMVRFGKATKVRHGKRRKGTKTSHGKSRKGTKTSHGRKRKSKPN